MASEISYPIMVKSLTGSMRMGVQLVRSANDLQSTCTSFGYPAVLQKYIPIKYDYRVVVVNSKPLGALKRYCKEDYFLTTRKGGKRESVELPQEALGCAVRCTEKAGISFAGVDLLEDKNRFSCIEVNMSPQFRVFGKITQANVAGALCDFAQRKFQDQF